MKSEMERMSREREGDSGALPSAARDATKDAIVSGALGGTRMSQQEVEIPCNLKSWKAIQIAFQLFLMSARSGPSGGG